MDPAPPAPRGRWPALLVGGLVVGAASVPLALAGTPAHEATWSVLSHVALLVAVAALATRVRAHRGVPRLPLQLLTLAIALPALHSALFSFLPPSLGYVTAPAGQLVAAVLDLGGAICGVAVPLLLIRAHRRTLQPAAGHRADAAVIAGAAAVVTWEILVAATGGTIVDGRDVWVAILAAGALAAASALLTALLFSGASRHPAAWLLAAGAALGATSAVVLGIAGEDDRTLGIIGVEATFVACAFLAAAAAHHPSMTHLLRPDGSDVGERSRASVGRVAVLAAAVVVPSLTAAYRSLVAVGPAVVTPIASRRASLPPAIVGVVITAIVSWRLWRLVVEREEARRVLDHQARHDGLTQLPNRTAVLDTLTALTRRPTGGALLYLDLDGFKRVNDTMGHRAGDTVLVETGRRMRRAVRDGDTVGRLAGDEFVVLCPGPISVDEAVAVAARVRAAIRRPIELERGRHATRVDASIGVAVTAGAIDGPEAGQGVLHTADAAMYEAKRAGGGIRVCRSAPAPFPVDGRARWSAPGHGRDAVTP